MAGGKEPALYVWEEEERRKLRGPKPVVYLIFRERRTRRRGSLPSERGTCRKRGRDLTFQIP